jgi:hypothetical protein
MNPILIFLEKYKKQIAVGLAATFLLVAAFFAGKYSTPTKVEYKEHVEYQDKIIYQDKITYQDRVVYQDRIVEKKVYVKADDAKKHTETKTVETKRPDGTTEKVTTTTTDTDNHSVVTNTDNKTDNVNVDKSTKTEEDKTVKENKNLKEDKSQLVVNDKPGWRVAGSLGIDFNKIGPKELLVTTPTQYPLVYGLEVDRRLVGTVWLGIQANTMKTGSLVLSLEF